MKRILNKEYPLTPKAIDDCVGEVYARLTDTYHLERRQALRLRLSLEEILLNWMTWDDEGSVLFLVEQRGKKLDLNLRLTGSRSGVPVNPLRDSADSEASISGLSGAILADLGIDWMHQFVDGQNSVNTRVIWKKERPLLRIAIALALAVLTILILRLQPAATASFWTDNLISPLFDTFLRALMAVVGPLMFLTVVNGFMGIGSLSHLDVVGRKICGHYLSMTLDGTILGAVLFLIFFRPGIAATASGGGQGKALLDMVLDIIPSNIFSPFTDGNTIQIIFMAAIAGYIMLANRSRIDAVEKLAEQLNLIVQQILEIILWFLPAFIYLSILRLGLTSDLSSLSRFIQTLLAMALGIAVLALQQMISVRIYRKQPFSQFLPSLLPAALIALLTASSAATFTEAGSHLTEDLKIQNKLVDFGLPLGYILCKPGTSLWIALFSGTCMVVSGIPFTPVKLVILVLTVFVLAVATPPVPGGGMMCYTLLFAQLGIPTDMIAIASVFEFLLDGVMTANTVFSVQTQLLISSAQLKTARKKSSKIKGK